MTSDRTIESLQADLDALRAEHARWVQAFGHLHAAASPSGVVRGEDPGAMAREASHVLAEVQEQLGRARGDAAQLRAMVADLFDLRDMLTEDMELLGFGKDANGKWHVWHVEYPDEGSIPLSEELVQ